MLNSSPISKNTHLPTAVVSLQVTRPFLAGMLERDHGHVVVVGSMAGKVGVAGQVDYAASKFGAVGFAESLRSELRTKSRQLQVTLVCPYYINTGMFSGVRSTSPLLLPILETEQAAERIQHAILTDMAIYQLPQATYYLMLLKS